MSRTQQPVLTLSAKNETGSTIAAHRFITAASALCGANARAIGVSEYEALDGKEMAVIAIGVAVIEAGAAYSAGALLVSDSTGRAVTATAASALTPTGGVAVLATSATPTMTMAGGYLPQHVLGVALEAASGAGSFGRILLK